MLTFEKFLCESNYNGEIPSANEIIFNCCLAIENSRKLYDRQQAIVANLKKHLDGFDIEKLEGSSMIDSFAREALKDVQKSYDAPIKLDSDSRKLLKKFIIGQLFKEMQNEIDLPEELDNYRMNWDYADSEKLNW